MRIDREVYRMRRFWLVFLLTASALPGAQPARAQQQAAMPVVGVLSTSSPAARQGDQFNAFRAGLKDGGYTEGQNARVEYRWAADNYTQLSEFAAELVRSKVDVIVAAGGHVSALTAQKATKEIPIVFTTVTDPVKDGLVASLARPGGNATGTAGLTSELDSKRLELLYEIKPASRTVGVLVNPNRPGLATQVTELETAAAKLKLKLEFARAATPEEIDAAFAALVEKRVDALIVTADPFFNNRRNQVVALAAKHALPAIYQWRQFVTAGGLMSYGPSITEAYRHAGVNASRILKGAKPADIPVVQPTKFELSINQKTATALGLTLSTSFLSIAEVIE
jgi:putative ABC transport system substrate-binding protein